MVLHVMLSTTNTKIYEKARSVALNLLGLLLRGASQDPVSQDSMEYELTMWVDGMSRDLLPALVSVLDEMRFNAPNICLLSLTPGTEQSSLALLEISNIHFC